MKAFILAAGKGERMRPLTNNTPKPLLQVGDTTLLDRQIKKLMAAGIHEIIVNAAYLSEKISEHLKHYADSDIHVQLSLESEPLETGGAILHAAELLGSEPFLLVNGDVWMDLDYAAFLASAPALEKGEGHLALVPNPEHKKEGDFALSGARIVLPSEQVNITGASTYTFSGVSILSPSIVNDYPRCRRKFPLVEAFHWAIQSQRLSGSVYEGYWLDVGTPERLEQLREHFTC